MKRLFFTLASLLMVLLTTGHAQGTLDTVFSNADLAALERLVTLAQTQSTRVLEARGVLQRAEIDASFEGRLAEALTIRAGAGLSNDSYGQAKPSYSLNLSLDVMTLARSENHTTLANAKLSDALAKSRVDTVEAFVRYLIARNAAEAAARALESADANHHIAHARWHIGEATLADQVSAQSSVASAAVTLLRANGEVIIALEQLAAVVGASPERTLATFQPRTLAER